MYFIFNHTLEAMKNTTCIEIEQCLEFDTVISTFIGKGILYQITKKHVLLKGVCFIGPQNQRFRLKMCSFLPQSAKGGGGGGGGVRE